MPGAFPGKRGSDQASCPADTRSRALPAHSCASAVSLAIGSGRAPWSRPFMLRFPIGGNSRGPAPRRPGQPEASMAAAGAAATDLGAVGFGWRARRGGLAGGMSGWGARSQTGPSRLGSGARHAGAARTESPGSSHLSAIAVWRARTLVPEPQSAPCALRGGPGQALRAVLRRGGHPAGTAALVEDHGDLPSPVALLRDQWAECPAGET